MYLLKKHLILVLVMVTTTFHCQEKLMPIGFFSPTVAEDHTIYLYSEESLNVKTPGLEKAVDSITFIKKGYTIIVDKAPSWFAPIHNKIDYGIFFISVKKLGLDYVELIANEETGKTIYMLRQNGDFVSWEEFLLSIHSVEFISEKQKIFDNPMVKSAGRVYDQAIFLKPMYVMGDWMQVTVLGSDFKATGTTGWIRWRKDNTLLIRYNLLS